MDTSNVLFVPGNMKVKGNQIKFNNFKIWFIPKIKTLPDGNLLLAYLSKIVSCAYAAD